MKQIITIAIFLFVAVQSVEAQKFKALDKSPLDQIEYPGTRGEAQWARILYSRPQLNGRAIETLVPQGEIWRLGANESTELTLYSPMKVGGNSLEAGRYTMYAIPSEGQMTIIINKATSVWGAYSYSKDLDVARVTVPLTEGSDSIEAFSMIFEEADMGMDLHLGWGYFRAKLEFRK
ncbi:DUF2911 domain-containing protein [Flavobacteriaceae bacterium]|jgi:hypothetical protein|nr:DUF2911 domain-containing protein [Flavobacteriaceae bacterium]